MSKNTINMDYIAKRLKYRSVEFNTEKYNQMLNGINRLDFSDLSDSQLKDISMQLKDITRKDNGKMEAVTTAFALARVAASRVLDMRPYDVQVLAALALHEGTVVEMQTGEGKTLAAVMPAYLNALTGKGVHILTFNDYLARRDAEWMGPVYRFLGLSVGYVNEGMSPLERKKAYDSDITYLTAKEAGFDYLKGFLAFEKEELVQRPFNFAIVDEADSIMIDEARVPLVIAGKNTNNEFLQNQTAKLVKSLTPGTDYETDEYRRNVFLTDRGLSRTEEVLRCGNLYEDENLPILVCVQNALHAEVLLKRDVDYIVRNGKVQLVDEFTGRIAERRHWPHGLQEAVEKKEGLESGSKGEILGSITLQNFISLYGKVSGMTGTAVPASDEFQEFYGLKVVVIPTNRKNIRVDEPDWVFTHREAKYKAVVDEIVRVHKTGRPILAGTISVMESEELAARLKLAGVNCRVLNARNDGLEAEIIASAGVLGAVTVSTNMAGRGTDIKLGGEDGIDKDRIIELGGLYVIGTNRHESLRIDNQLRGRAGRQGDPGSSRFFVSLEDDLLKRFRIDDLIPERYIPLKQEAPLDNPLIAKKMKNIQRIIEGQNFDIRKTLIKYSVILEKQRQLIFSKRYRVLRGEEYKRLMPEKLKNRYEELLGKAGENGLIKAERQVTMFYLNKCWADYLDYMSYIRESIHLVNFAGKVPVDEFNKTAAGAFEKLKEEIENEIISVLDRAEITENGISMEKEGLNAPTSTWTYLVNDRPEQMGINPIAMNNLAAIFQMPVWLTASIFYRFFRKSSKIE